MYQLIIIRCTSIRIWKRRYKKWAKLNTLELLWEQKEAESKEEKLIESDYQEEIYRDIEHFKQYINDPIRLLTELRKNKGI